MSGGEEGVGERRRRGSSALEARAEQRLVGAHWGGGGVGGPVARLVAGAAGAGGREVAARDGGERVDELLGAQDLRCEKRADG